MKSKSEKKQTNKMVTVSSLICSHVTLTKSWPWKLLCKFLYRLYVLCKVL